MQVRPAPCRQVSLDQKHRLGKAVLGGRAAPPRTPPLGHAGDAGPKPGRGQREPHLRRSGAEGLGQDGSAQPGRARLSPIPGGRQLRLKGCRVPDLAPLEPDR